MEFRIADTLTDSLARLTGDEQKAVKTTVFDLQLAPSSPGTQFHKVERARDVGFWSVRVNSDLRLIIHRCRLFDKPMSNRVTVEVIDHLGDEVMKVFRVG